VKNDKSYLLYTELTKHCPGNGTERSMEVFKARLSEFVLLMLEPKNTHRFGQGLRNGKNDQTGWFKKVAALELSSDLSDPVFQQSIKDPQSLDIPKYVKPKVMPDGSGKGWIIPLKLAEGSQWLDHYKYHCPRRLNVIALKGHFTDYSLMRLKFTMPVAPRTDAKGAALVLEGQDCEKPGTTKVRISVNGEMIYKGENKFMEEGWSTWMIKLPSGLVKKGENELEIEDIEESSNIYDDWVIFSEIKIEDR